MLIQLHIEHNGEWHCTAVSTRRGKHEGFCLLCCVAACSLKTTQGLKTRRHAHSHLRNLTFHRYLLNLMSEFSLLYFPQRHHFFLGYWVWSGFLPAVTLGPGRGTDWRSMKPVVAECHDVFLFVSLKRQTATDRAFTNGGATQSCFELNVSGQKDQKVSMFRSLRDSLAESHVLGARWPPWSPLCSAGSVDCRSRGAHGVLWRAEDVPRATALPRQLL